MNHNATFDCIEIPLAVIGYDFRIAGAGMRSRLVTKPDQADELHRRLEDSGIARGLVVLDTCNRNEWIVSSSTPQWAAQILKAQFIRRLKKDDGEGKIPDPYVFTGIAAVEHLLRVVSGIESFVIGERQIATQLNCAFNIAKQRQRSSVILNGLSPLLGRVAREAAQTQLGDTTLRGVHDAAVRFLTERHDPKQPYSVVVVGTGAIGRQVNQSLKARTNWQTERVNRTITFLQRDKVQPLERLPELLQQADAAILCTSSEKPLLGARHILPREGRELTIVDIGIPVQSETALSELDKLVRVDLDTLQDLLVIPAGNSEGMRHMRRVIREAMREFTRFCRERNLVKVLETTQNQHERYIKEVIPQLLDTELPQLSQEDRNRLAFRLRGLIREYTNSIFNSIHEITENADEQS